MGTCRRRDTIGPVSGLQLLRSPLIRIVERWRFLSAPWFLLFIYLGLAAFLTAYQLWIRPGSINNYIIFRTSFEHLCQNADLYALHPDKHNDVFRYSPTFAFCMAPFRALPIGIGLLLWNVLNAGALYFAVRSLPISRAAGGALLLFVIPQLNGSIQNNQSNGLMAGLMIGTIAAMERGKPVAASSLAALGFFIKVYGAAVGMLFVCFARRVRFFISGVIAAAALALAPACITGVSGLIEHYREWFEQLKAGGPKDMKYSVMTVFEKWSGMAPPNWVFMAPGLVLVLLPLLRVRQYRHRSFRIMYAAYLMVFVVVFNPMAESPTYIIAMAGVALWGVVEPRTWLRLFVLAAVYLMTGWAHSDLCPERWREEYVVKYGLKAVPCIAAWLVMAYRLIVCDGSRLSAAALLQESTGSETPSAAPKV